MTKQRTQNRSSRSSTRGRRRRAARRRPARLALPALLFSGAAVAVAAWWLLPQDSDPRADLSAPSAPGSGAASPSTSAPAPKPTPKATPPPSPTPAPVVPEKGPGTFRASTVGGTPHGSGTVRRYRVEAEDGTGIDPNEAARAVDAILADPRGWTHDPAYAFRLTASGPVEFTVRIATPTTTDRLCEVVTAELKGEANCRSGHEVIVNLRRWLLGSPQFDGPVGDYRALIVNHEVGHELGRGHETCPGPGLPAPAMMQQIKGLMGCRSNAWPYDARGNYLRGPLVP